MAARRTLKLSDLLILIVFVALGFAWALHYLDYCEQSMESHPDPDEAPPVLYRIQVVYWWFVAISHCVAAMVPCMLVLRLRQPRPRFRRLTRQPGVVACGAISLAIAMELIALASRIPIGLKAGIPIRDIGHITCFYLTVQPEAQAVAVAWILLAANRNWRRERSWIDDIGICLGGWWLGIPILLGLALFVAEFFWI